MALKMPVKILSDDNRVPFIPFVTTDGVFVNGTNQTVNDYFGTIYTKTEVDAKFAALGTVMDFKGVVENESQLPATAEDGDVYLVLHYQEGIITHGVIWTNGAWVDMGTPIDLEAYYTKTEVNDLVSTAIANNNTTERATTDADIASSLATAKQYTDDAIVALNMDNYYTIAQTQEYVYNNHTIPYRKGTPESPLIINELFPTMRVGELFYILMTGTVKATSDATTSLVLDYYLYGITVTGTNTFNIDTYLPDGTLKRYTLTASNSTVNTYTWLTAAAYADNVTYTGTRTFNQVITALAGINVTGNESVSGNLTVGGNTTVTGSLKCNTLATEDNDVITKQYLDEQVVGPMTKLIERLQGYSSSEEV